MANKILSYFKESKEELSKVVWPTRKQTIEMTVAVIIISLLVGGYLGGVDFLLSKLMSIIIGD
ncbi:MAG: preprotein translocase subunit SecE [Patescibacteria group bacterium]|nr:preprotein translocase subunit SecE [Patescibacteria group bacterium]